MASLTLGSWVRLMNPCLAISRGRRCDQPRCCSNTRVAMPTWSGWRLKDTLPFPWRIIERPKDRGGRYPSLGSDSCGISVPIGSLNRLLLWGMFLATLPHSLLGYGCEIFATLRVFLNRSQSKTDFLLRCCPNNNGRLYRRGAIAVGERSCSFCC